MVKSIVARYAKAAVAIVLAGAAVVFVITRASSGSRSLPSQFELAEAVPVDAAAVLFGSSVQRTARILGPKSQLAVFLDSVLNDDSLCGAIEDSKPIVSWHFNGKLVPLMILAEDSSPSDSLVFRLRAVAGRGISVASVSRGGGNILLISPSSELVNSSQRHLADGSSVISRPGFETASKSLSADSFMVLSNEYMSRMVPALKGFSSWIAVSLDGTGSDFELQGLFIRGESDAALAEVLEMVKPTSFAFPSAVPGSATYAVAVSLGGYRTGYERYLARTSLLERNKQLISQAGRQCGVNNALEWADSFNEIVLVQWKQGKSRRKAVLLHHTGKTEQSPAAQDGRAELLPLLFGQFFTPDGACSASLAGGWIAFSGKDTLSELEMALDGGDTLEARLDGASLGSAIPTAGAVVYNALDLDNSSLYGRGIDAHVSAFASGASFAPLFASFKDGRIRVRAVRLPKQID